MDLSQFLFPVQLAAVTTIEYEPGLRDDFPEMLSRVAPENIQYKHDNNSDIYDLTPSHRGSPCDTQPHFVPLSILIPTNPKVASKPRVKRTGLIRATTTPSMPTGISHASQTGRTRDRTVPTASTIRPSGSNKKTSRTGIRICGGFQSKKDVLLMVVPSSPVSGLPAN